MQVFTFDATLRDGTSGEGVSLSVDDKLVITQKLFRPGAGEEEVLIWHLGRPS